ncbi:hypothetical protein FRB99_003716 [Tulasnella sp. 403]|nr:hypothetical protein FRB99_003716 [Tulasnella sp. 403]
MSPLLDELRIHNEDYDIQDPLAIHPSAQYDRIQLPHHSFNRNLPKPRQSQDMIATVLPPILPRHHPQQQDSLPPREPSPPPPAPAPQPILPPQQRPAPVVDARERVTVTGIPSQTIVDGNLVIGHDTSTSVRSYTPLKNVGDGSFGTVVLADWHSPLPPGVSISPMQLNIKVSSSPSAPRRMVAIKRMKKKWQNGWAECKQLKELESLRRIHPHPNIIPLYDSFLLPETKELYFVFECMEGNLYQLIKSRKGRPLAGGLVASIYRQVVEGLRHIHDAGYFHRDMKPENLLVTTTGLADYSPTSPLCTQPPHLAPPEKDVMVIVKLADFGLAREVSSQPPYTEYVSTRWYRAPEVLLRSRNYSKPVDMWALGTILAELVNLKPLFPGQRELDQVRKITEVLGNPTANGDWGRDDRGRPRGGGDWIRGIKMAAAVGYFFPTTKPIRFHTLFHSSVPRSLIDCIADLIRYDPDKRLTAHDCKNHPYWKETENTQRAPIATQPTLNQVQPDQQHGQQVPQQNGTPAEHPRRRPSHVPRPPDTNASAASSNRSLRAAVSSMGLHSHSQAQQAGYSRGHSRTHSTHQSMSVGHVHGLVLPQMSPRVLPPSHSHPLSPGKTKPAFSLTNGNANADVPPLPLPIPLIGLNGRQSHTSSSQQTSVPPQSQHASSSNSHPNLQISTHRTGPECAFSPVTPSASPGLLMSPSSQPGDFPPTSVSPSGAPGIATGPGAVQYHQAASAHYTSVSPGHHQSSRGYTGRSHGSIPGTSRSGELVEQMRDLDLPPPVPPLPWNVNGREGMISSVAATVGSNDYGYYDQHNGIPDMGYDCKFATNLLSRVITDSSTSLVMITDEPEASMEISRGSLDLPQPADQTQHVEKPIIVTLSKPLEPSSQFTSPPQGAAPPAQSQQQGNGGKFHIGFGFKKHKTWGLFGHSNVSSADAKTPNGMVDSGGDSHMSSSTSMPSMPAVPVVTAPTAQQNSLKRGPSGSAGSLREIQSPSVAEFQPPPPPPAPVDAKTAKKLAEKAKKEEARIRFENQRLKAQARSRAVMQKRKEEESVRKVNELEWETTRDTAATTKDLKGKGVLRPPDNSSSLGLSPSRGDGRPSGVENSLSGKTLVGVSSPDGEEPGRRPSQSHYPHPHSSQPYPYELQHHSSRYKAQKRNTDDDVHSMSSSDVHSISRMSAISRSTVDSDPGPARPNYHRMNIGNGMRGATLGPYPTNGSGISRATSASNLRSGSSFSRGLSPSARSSTSLDQPFLAELDELALQAEHDGGSHPHMNLGTTMVSPPMQMLTLNGVVSRNSQSPPLQDGPSPLQQKNRSHSRGRLVHQQGPSPYLGMPTLPTISSIHSPTYTNSTELSVESTTPPYELAPPSGASASANESYPLPNAVNGSQHGQVLPPFSHIASWADQSMQQPQ